MSFRGRLLLFFVLIVVVPMIVVAVLVVSITTDSRIGKADAALDAGIQTALSVNGEISGDSQRLTQSVAQSPGLADVVRRGKASEAELSQLATQFGLSFLSLQQNGDLTDTGNGPAVGTSVIRLSGSASGSLQGSTTSADQFVARLRLLTGDGVAVLSGNRVVRSRLPADNLDLPAAGQTIEQGVSNGSVRLTSANLANTDGLRVVLSTPIESKGFLGSRPLVAAALAGFFLAALALVLFVMRSMRTQVGVMLGAARKIGDGDFSTQVPVVGRDELAGLAGEFNKMSGRLEAQVGELRSQRVEIDRSLKRLGEAIATGLDRNALIVIVIETALSACAASFGRVALSDHTVVREGDDPGDDLKAAIRDAELNARGGIAVSKRGEAHAIAAPLVRIGTSHALGVISVAREGKEFGRNERDVLLYLAGQASASISNIAEQQLATEEAMTDPLTGLSNRRAFSEWLEMELERAYRFDHELSLVMIDLDDFKSVNDTFGHLQGDAVLEAVAGILAAESRAIDSASRYGGEEFAIALPETGPAGALEQAERLRELIEAEGVPLADGKVLKVTASFGTATSPEPADSVRALIATADSALYSAKRKGKNCVVAATERVEPNPLPGQEPN